MSTQLVLTIHGIHSRGEWHDDVSAVLAPHFRCEPLGYPSYRWLGIIRVVMSPTCFVLAAATAGAATYFGLWNRSAILMSLAVMLVFGFYLPFRSRFLTARHLAKGYDGYVRHAASAPHVIAHSFGTRLFADLLHHHTHSKFGRVVLIGSVLPRDFSWGRYIRNAQRRRVYSVRNEVRSNDWVVWLAGVLGKVFRHLGPSGRKGFEGPLVHTVQIGRPCDRCASGTGANVHVHDVETRGDHAFAGRGHIRYYWLPELWGFDPTEYERFLVQCRELADGESHLTGEVAAKIRAFENSRWSWTERTSRRVHRLTLFEYLHWHLKEEAKRKGLAPAKPALRRATHAAVRSIWLCAGAALDLMESPERTSGPRRGGPAAPRDPAADFRLLALNPTTAVRRAVQAVAQPGVLV